MSSPRPLRLLLLFQTMWEEECVAALRRDHDVVLEREGFDSQQPRGLLRLLTLDASAWLDRLCATYRGRIDAVWSNDDQIGTLLAACIAQRLGLPGADPAGVVRAQHKLLLRRTLATALPDATVPVTALPWRLGDRRTRDPRALAAAATELGVVWPRFAKPVKASFSVLARRVAGPDELAGHLALPWYDRLLLGTQDRLWARLAANVLPLPCPPDHVLLEQPLRGQQVNVDGYACRGDVRVLGLVDECMYTDAVRGARHFAGFTYPSRLPPDVQQRVATTAAAAVRAVGYDHGVFNVELFVLPDGGVRVIEINPRGAGQFASLYREAAGVDVERLTMRLAAGLDPELPATMPSPTGVAASFVFRAFDGGPGPVPEPSARAWLARRHPRSQLWTEPCSRAALRREYRWVGSHRYGVWNHTAPDFGTLFRDGDEVARRLFGVALPAGVVEGPEVGRVMPAT